MPELTPRQIAAEFLKESAFRCEIAALVWHVVLLSSWGLCVVGGLSRPAFLVVGLCAYVRNFNALHRLSHCPDVRKSRLGRVRLLMHIVHGPVQYGFDEMASDHRGHHASPRDPERDPDAHLNTGPWWRALAGAATQPEQGILRWLRREGWSLPLVRVVLWNGAFTAGLAYAGGLRGLLWWVALTRLGSTIAWFVFDWVLHHERLWGSALPTRIPTPLGLLWQVLFGRDNFRAVQHHALHHSYPFVRDRDLPRLSRRLRECAAEAPLASAQ